MLLSILDEVDLFFINLGCLYNLVGSIVPNTNQGRQLDPLKYMQKYLPVKNLGLER